MSDWLKLVIAAAVALTVGFVVGYMLAAMGKSDLVAKVAATEQRAAAARDTLEQERAECEKRAQIARRTTLMLQTKEHLLRAQTELFSNNYGLASQQLANARGRLQAASKLVPAKLKDSVKKLFDGMGNTQTLVMRLDPMARTQLEDLLRAVQRLPGAR